MKIDGAENRPPPQTDNNINTTNNDHNNRCLFQSPPPSNPPPFPSGNHMEESEESADGYLNWNRVQLGRLSADYSFHDDNKWKETAPQQPNNPNNPTTTHTFKKKIEKTIQKLMKNVTATED